MSPDETFCFTSESVLNTEPVLPFTHTIKPCTPNHLRKNSVHIFSQVVQEILGDCRNTDCPPQRPHWACVCEYLRPCTAVLGKVVGYLLLGILASLKRGEIQRVRSQEHPDIMVHTRDLSIFPLVFWCAYERGRGRLRYLS